MSKSKAEHPYILSRNLTYVHKIPILKTKMFWDRLKEGVVMATKCNKCGKIYYPPHADCPDCLTSNLEWIELSKEGEIETFVASFLKPQAFEHFKEPYIIAIAMVREGVKIMGLVEDIDYKNVNIGMKVRISAKLGDDGFPVIILKPL